MSDIKINTPLNAGEVRILDLSGRELVNLLDKSYPHRCKARGETDESVDRYAGRRELIDELKSMLDEELEEQTPHQT